VVVDEDDRDAFHGHRLLFVDDGLGTGRYAEARRLLDVILPVASDLSLPVVLERIVAAACELVGARYGALGVLAEDSSLAEFITVGIDAETIARIGPPPEGHGVLGLLIWDPKPVRMDDIGQHASSYGFPANHPPMHSFLGAPVLVRGEVFGNLYLSEKRDAARFSQEDEDLVVGLAAVAGVAIENARLHARVRDVAVVEDRARIARDLHDTVIQQLYATGLSLTAALRLTERTEVRERLSRSIDDLDRTMRSIRSTIFALEAADREDAGGLRSAVVRLVGRSENALGFSPRLTLDGLVDTLVSEGIGDHVVAALRESLSNVAKHAHARRVDVEVVVEDGSVLVRVSDDGVGVPDDPRVGSGLANLAERATALGGTFTATRRDTGGTVATWRVPLERPPREPGSPTGE
jgi:signal transduction histidine kinase